MNNPKKAKTIRKLKVDLENQEQLYDTLSKKLISIDSYSPEWKDIVEKYNLCAFKINFLEKQIEILKRTGRKLGEPEEEKPTIYGQHYCDYGNAL